MSLDISKLLDNAIADCRTADDARSVLHFFDAIYDLLNADCKCTRVVADKIASVVDITCWPCLLRAAWDRED